MTMTTTSAAPTPQRRRGGVKHRDGEEEEEGATQPNMTRRWKKSTARQPNAKAERPHNDRSQPINKEGS